MVCTLYSPCKTSTLTTKSEKSSCQGRGNGTYSPYKISTYMAKSEKSSCQGWGNGMYSPYKNALIWQIQKNLAVSFVSMFKKYLADMSIMGSFQNGDFFHPYHSITFPDGLAKLEMYIQEFLSNIRKFFNFNPCDANIWYPRQMFILWVV